MDELDKDQFLRDCLSQFARHGESDARFLFDNRLIVPESIKQQFLPVVKDETALEDPYKEFIQNKFKYLTFLAQDPMRADTCMYEQLGADVPNWLYVLARLREDRWQEESVYLYRISQLPPDKVHRCWYNDLDEFEDWSKHWKDSVDRILEEDPLSSLFGDLSSRLTDSAKGILDNTRVTSLVKNWVIEQIAEMLALLEFRNSSVEALQKALEERLQGAVESEFYPLYAHMVEELRNELTSTFVTMFCEGQRFEGNYIEALLSLLREKFNCELCDFLSLSCDDRGPGLTLVRTTVDPVLVQQTFPRADPETLFGMLQKFETYLNAEGMTGSLLLLSGTDGYSHSGSNALTYDQRKSETHLSGYEVIYKGSLRAGGGKIRNFFAFPLLQEDKAQALVRVVNKLNDAGELETTGWSLFTRLQLCVFAKWFSNVWWPIIASYKIEEAGHWAIVVNEWSQLIDDLVEELVGWREHRSQISMILREMRGISERQVEEKRFGCCIAFGTEQDCTRLVGDFESARRSPGIERRAKLDDVFRLCRRYDWNKEILVFDENCLLVKVIDIGSTEAPDTLPAQELLRDYPILVFMVEPTRRSVRIFREGKWKAEYLLHPHRGDWELRLFESSLKKLLQAVPNLRDDLAERLWQTSWYVSYYGKKGKMIVCGDNLTDKLLLDGGTEPPSPVDVYSGEFLGYALEEEGAVCVSGEGQVVKYDAVVDPIQPVSIPSASQKKLDEEEKGSKHRDGARNSVACPDGLVFVISQDRGITIFRDGKDIFWAY